jgi:succinylglutamate desuccinylase
MTKILLVGSQHGHEKLGDYLIDFIKQHRPELLESVDFVIANPKAHARSVRQIESDMNRSYSGKNTTYEEGQATALLQLIRNKKYCFVLDLHTTTLEQSPCIITANLKQARQFIDASTIKNVVLMPRKIAKVSLIGNVGNSVSIEINQRQAQTEQLLTKICADIARFIQSQKSTTTHSFYKVTDYLSVKELSPEQVRRLTNFRLSKFGFYPVLVGEQSYGKNLYIGFKAKK